MKILITGGHLAPALAFINELFKKREKGSIKIIFVGRRYPLEKERTLSLEYKEITRKGIKFIPLETGRLTRVISLKTVRSLLMLPIGLLQAGRIVYSEHPEVIVSFGGYLALPIVLWGFLLRIPIFIHEQTIQPGLSNRIASYFSRKIFLAFEEAKKYFPKNKTIITGNPVRQAIFSVKKKPFSFSKDRPVIYITGGSLGSHSINVHVQKILPSLLEKYIVIHQTGETKEYRDLEILSSEVKKLPSSSQRNYFPAKHFLEEEIGYIYSQADLVVSRSGANTFFELIALEKPAILIPLPWSSGGEQIKHAQIFSDAGCGVIFHQTENSERLLSLIDKMIKEKDIYKEKFIALKNLYKKNAAEFIVEEVFKNI